MAVAGAGGADGGGGGDGWKNHFCGGDKIKIDVTTEKGTNKKVECKKIAPTEEELSYLGEAWFASIEFNEALDDLLCRSEKDKAFADRKHHKHPQHLEKTKRCKEAYQKYKGVLTMAEEKAETVMVKYQVKKLALETQVRGADYASYQIVDLSLPQAERESIMSKKRNSLERAKNALEDHLSQNPTTSKGKERILEIAYEKEKKKKFCPNPEEEGSEEGEAAKQEKEASYFKALDEYANHRWPEDAQQRKRLLLLSDEFIAAEEACRSFVEVGHSLPEAERSSKRLELDNRRDKARREYNDYMHDNPHLQKPPSPPRSPLQPHPVCETGNCTHTLCTKRPRRDE